MIAHIGALRWRCIAKRKNALAVYVMMPSLEMPLFSILSTFWPLLSNSTPCNVSPQTQTHTGVCLPHWQCLPIAEACGEPSPIHHVPNFKYRPAIPLPSTASFPIIDPDYPWCITIYLLASASSPPTRRLSNMLGLCYRKVPMAIPCIFSSVFLDAFIGLMNSNGIVH